MGINLDPYLSYDDHISKLVSSCMRKLCQINRVKDSFDNETLKLVIETLVISKLFTALRCGPTRHLTISINFNQCRTSRADMEMYSYQWRFEFNPSKTTIVTFGETTQMHLLKKPLRSWYINGVKISEKPSWEHVGIIKNCCK